VLHEPGERAAFFDALADPTRRRVLELLADESAAPEIASLLEALLPSHENATAVL
jgi:DNA-binding transcriptional ArsR family regulator